MGSTGRRRPCWSLEVLCGHYCCHQDSERCRFKGKKYLFPGHVGRVGVNTLGVVGVRLGAGVGANLVSSMHGPGDTVHVH